MRVEERDTKDFERTLLEYKGAESFLALSMSRGGVE